MMKSIEEYANRQESMCRAHDAIDRRLYDEYGVNCGLRDESLLKVLVTVSKKHFKHAVDRNRTKRLLREAWRLHRNEILQLLRLKQTGGLDVALIWLDDKLWTAKDVDKRMSLLLKRLSDKLSEQLTHANKANVSTDVSDKLEIIDNITSTFDSFKNYLLGIINSISTATNSRFVLSDIN